MRKNLFFLLPEREIYLSPDVILPQASSAFCSRLFTMIAMSYALYLSDAGYTKSDLNRMPILSAAFCLSFTITSVTAFPVLTDISNASMLSSILAIYCSISS